MMAGFSGFSKELVVFLQGLAANNSKDWFAASRSLYDETYVASALAFIEAIASDVSRLSPSLQAVPKLNKSLRRINRDVRFARDKRPYNTRLHMIFWTGDHPSRSPAMHVVVAHDHFGFGSGQWGFGPDMLKAYRKAVSDPARAKALQKAIDGVCGGGEYTLDPPALARVPKGFDPGAPHAELLRHKGVVLKGRIEPHPDWLFTPDVTRRIMEQINRMMPLHRWLVDHVNG